MICPLHNLLSQNELRDIERNGQTGLFSVYCKQFLLCTNSHSPTHPAPIGNRVLVHRRRHRSWPSPRTCEAVTAITTRKATRNKVDMRLSCGATRTLSVIYLGSASGFQLWFSADEVRLYQLSRSPRFLGGLRFHRSQLQCFFAGLWRLVRVVGRQRSTGSYQSILEHQIQRLCQSAGLHRN